MSSLLLALAACGEPALSVGEAPALMPVGGRVRLALVGDTGKGNEGQARVAAAMERVCAAEGCDAVVITGDLLYPVGMASPDDPRAQAWVAEPYTPVADRVFLSLGNHDYGRGRNRQSAAWLRDWAARTPGVEHPGDVYRVSLGVGALHILDTNAAFQWGHGPQQRWLLDALPSTDGWRVVAGHHTFRSEGQHGNAGQYEGWSGVPWLSGTGMAKLFENTLCPHADLYIAGHDHDLQVLEHCDVTLVVTGAGASTRPLVGRGNDPVIATDDLGFVWVELTEAGKGRAVVYDAEGVALGSHRFDRRLRNAP